MSKKQGLDPEILAAFSDLITELHQWHGWKWETDSAYRDSEGASVCLRRLNAARAAMAKLQGFLPSEKRISAARVSELIGKPLSREGRSWVENFRHDLVPTLAKEDRAAFDKWASSPEGKLVSKAVFERGSK